MKRLLLPLLLGCIVVFIAITAFSQNETFRHGVFLHHSTGGNIWGPNGSNTSVPIQVAHYNQVHGLYGPNEVSLTESWFPVNNDNEWATWHTIFEQSYPEGICLYCATNPLLMIKSCYPSSNMSSVGMPIDTLTPTYKSLYNYKWHWRHIIKVMENHPEHFFVLWTNAPLVMDQTNPTEAYISNWFCTWAKDTLAAGLDAVYGAFPPNVHIFDYYHKVANAQGYLNPVYAVSPWDSHPNAAATELVAPQLVNETFDASIVYETSLQIRNITGHLVYNNADSTPLANVRVQLKLGCCTYVDTVYTDAQGAFVFTDLSPAYYTIEPVISKPWGGVNADDGAMILKDFVGMVSLSGLRSLASNIDGNHITNANDALLAVKRFVGLINTFTVGDWIYDYTQVSLTGSSDVNVTIKALCNGDVNGSYIP